MKNSNNQFAFTLIELLCVLAVVAILATVSVAAIGHFSTSGKVTQCIGNLRAIGAASALFSTENDGLLPQSTHQGPNEAWQYQLPPYLDEAEERIFKSPLAANPRQPISYAINDFLTRRPYGAEDINFSRRQSIPYPSQTFLFSLVTKDYGSTDHFHFADSEGGGASPEAFASQVLTKVANGRGHYLFVDGHVAAIPWEEVRNQLQSPGARFVDPRGN